MASNTAIALFIKHPSGQGAGTRVDAFVYNLDTFATALALLDVKPPMGVPSRNLWPLVEEVSRFSFRVSRGGGAAEPETRNTKRETAPRGHVVLGFNYDVMVRTERWGYIARGDGSNARLYDLHSDPGWHTDVAADHDAQLKEFHQLVEHEAGGPLPRYENVRQGIATEWYRL